MSDEIKTILEKLKDNIPIEEYRSDGTSDGLTHYEEDKDSWQYKLLDYITNLQTIEQQYSAILSENAELENKLTNLQKEVRINNDVIPYLKNKEKNLKKQITILQKENEKLLKKSYSDDVKITKAIEKLKYYKAKPYNEYDVDDVIIDLDYILNGGDE